MDTSVLWHQRALGAVIGSAVGDALGAPFEFGAPNAYAERFPQPVVGGTSEMVGGGGFGWKPGEFTDDTQMAIIQAQSVLANNGIDGADLFDRFRTWAPKAPDVGNQTRSVLNSPLPWDEAAAAHAAKHPDRVGNGTIMRAAPTAVYFASGSIEDTIAAAKATAAITHGQPAAGWGTALLHVMIRAALGGNDPFAALADQLAQLPSDQARFQRMLAPDWEPAHMEVPNGSVWGCLAQAVWAVRTTETFDDAVVGAINLGGDTDTVAAVAGGLAGSVYGIQAIPSRWTTYLNGRTSFTGADTNYRYVDLQELANALLGKGPVPMTPLTAPRGPVEIAPGVSIADLGGAAATPTDRAIISMCRTEDAFANHPARREYYIIDRAGRASNLDAVIDDAVASVDAFVAEGREVTIHCHGGASRTGLIARTWLMRHHGWTLAQATDHVKGVWPHLGEWNEDFEAYLRNHG